LTEIKASIPQTLLDAVREELRRCSNNAYDAKLNEVEKHARDAVRLESKAVHLRYEADFPVLRNVHGFVVQQSRGVAILMKQISHQPDDRQRMGRDGPPSDIGDWIPSQKPLEWEGVRPSWLIMVEEEANYLLGEVVKHFDNKVLLDPETIAREGARASSRTHTPAKLRLTTEDHVTVNSRHSQQETHSSQ
jgi:hypothetical protein